MPTTPRARPAAVVAGCPMWARAVRLPSPVWGLPSRRTPGPVAVTGRRTGRPPGASRPPSSAPSPGPDGSSVTGWGRGRTALGGSWDAAPTATGSSRTYPRAGPKFRPRAVSTGDCCRGDRTGVSMDALTPAGAAPLPLPLPAPTPPPPPPSPAPFVPRLGTPDAESGRGELRAGPEEAGPPALPGRGECVRGARGTGASGLLPPDAGSHIISAPPAPLPLPLPLPPAGVGDRGPSTMPMDSPVMGPPPPMPPAVAMSDAAAAGPSAVTFPLLPLLLHTRRGSVGTGLLPGPADPEGAAFRGLPPFSLPNRVEVGVAA